MRREGCRAHQHRAGTAKQYLDLDLDLDLKVMPKTVGCLHVRIVPNAISAVRPGRSSPLGMGVSAYLFFLRRRLPRRYRGGVVIALR